MTNYSTTEVSELTGISFRRLDYYWRTGRIPNAQLLGGGVPRKWTPEQVHQTP